LKKKAPLSDYARYSALGLQMAAIVTIMAFLGKYLDSFHWVKFPLFTVVGILIGIFAAMYYIIRQL
jgi:F0F1-type ATP synthase assembly protein I